MSVSLAEAVDLVAQLRKEIGSHLNAAERGWEFTATFSDMIAHIHATAFLNSNRDPKKNPTPFTLPAPWKTEAKAEDVTPEERAELRARLLRQSAFAQ